MFISYFNENQSASKFSRALMKVKRNIISLMRLKTGGNYTLIL